MKKIKKKVSKKVKFLIYTLIFFIIVLVVYAAQSYRVNRGGPPVTINEHNLCKVVTNSAAAADIFVPTNTYSEWWEFLTHLPSGVSAVDCSPSCGAWQANSACRCAGESVCNYWRIGAGDSSSCSQACKTQGAQCCEWYNGGECYGNTGTNPHISGGFSGWNAAMC